MIAISDPTRPFGDTQQGGTWSLDIAMAALREREGRMRAAAEKVTTYVRELEVKERELQRAVEAEFLGECKQGWHEPRRRAFPLSTRHPPLIPIAYQRRFRRRDRTVAAAPARNP